MAVRRPRIALVLACACLALAPARAADDKRDQAVKDVRAVCADVITAVNKNERDDVLRHLHPGVIVTWVDGKTSRGPGEVKDYYEEMRVGPGSKVETIQVTPDGEPKVDMYGDALAVAFGQSQDKLKLRHGAEYDVRCSWTATLIKDSGRWRIASLHLSTPPADNPLVLRSEHLMYLAGGIGAVIGVLFGFLIGRFSVRRTGTALPPGPPPPPLPRPFR